MYLLQFTIFITIVSNNFAWFSNSVQSSWMNSEMCTCSDWQFCNWKQCCKPWLVLIQSCHLEEFIPQCFNLYELYLTCPDQNCAIFLHLITLYLHGMYFLGLLNIYMSMYVIHKVQATFGVLIFFVFLPLHHMNSSNTNSMWHTTGD